MEIIILSFSKYSQSSISSSVGDGLHSNPSDVISVRQNLKRLGFDSGDLKHVLIDRKLDNAIRKFQRREGLNVDGRINPKGETEAAMNKALLKRMNDSGGETMPALPPGGIEKELLPPPNIPGTNIPDQSVPEGVVPGMDFPGDRDSWRYKIDPGIRVPYNRENPEWEI